MTKKNHLHSHRLTAYVAKVFSMANSLVAVRREQICNAIKYLILRAQNPDGSFVENGRVSHQEMIVCLICFSISPFLIQYKPFADLPTQHSHK